MACFEYRSGFGFCLRIVFLPEFTLLDTNKSSDRNACIFRLCLVVEICSQTQNGHGYR